MKKILLILALLFVTSAYAQSSASQTINVIIRPFMGVDELKAECDLEKKTATVEVDFDFISNNSSTVSQLRILEAARGERYYLNGIELPVDKDILLQILPRGHFKQKFVFQIRNATAGRCEDLSNFQFSFTHA